MPDDPGPEFRPVSYACDLRPARCGDCAANACEYGEEPGLRGLAERPRRMRRDILIHGDEDDDWGGVVWPPGMLVGDAFELLEWDDEGVDRGAGATILAECPLGCGWKLVAPDAYSAAAATDRHVAEYHGGAA